MKKLLGLLGVITITSSIMPTVIAASPHQKQEKNTKLENNQSQINYSQIDNLENLNRNKRSIRDQLNNLYINSFSILNRGRALILRISNNAASIISNLNTRENIRDALKIMAGVIGAATPGGTVATEGITRTLDALIERWYQNPEFFKNFISNSMTNNGIAVVVDNEPVSGSTEFYTQTISNSTTSVNNYQIPEIELTNFYNLHRPSSNSQHYNYYNNQNEPSSSRQHYSYYD